MAVFSEKLEVGGQEMDEGQCNESYVRKIRDRVNLLGYEALVRTGLIIEFGPPLHFSELCP